MSNYKGYNATLMKSPVKLSVPKTNFKQLRCFIGITKDVEQTGADSDSEKSLEINEESSNSLEIESEISIKQIL